MQQLPRLLLAPLIAGFALLAAVVVGTAWLAHLQQQDQAAAQRSLMIEAQISEVFSLVQDAETGQRGYLLTDDPAYLAPYEQASARLAPALGELQAALADHAELSTSLRQLDQLIRDRLAVLAEVLRLQRRGDRAGAEALVKSGVGRQLMIQIRTLVPELKRYEQRLLTERLASAKLVGRLLQAGILLAIAGVLALAFLAVRLTRNRTQITLQQQAQLQQANQQLMSEMGRREAAEAQVRQMQKLEAIGQLTGGIAHDFNNMLAVVISGLNLIQRRLARGDTNLDKLIEGTMEGATRAASLTQRLLAFSRQQPLAPKAIDCNRFVAGMSDLLHRTLGEHIRMETVLAAGLWPTHADPSQLENAIINLCVNGRDAMPAGGKLTIETANCHLDEAYGRVNGMAAGQYVLVAVTDTGSGMAPEVIAKAFDPFFTTKGQTAGTGLGLSQVYGFVKQSGGHVKIYSEPGQGTTVKIYLPRFIGVAEAPVQTAIRTLPSGHANEVVLVVEDEERVRQVSVEALRELGYTVIHADSAVAALRELDRHPAVTLLFTDIVMPDVNGRALADEAVKRRPGLKVLFTTGFTRNAVVHNGVLDAGVNFLPKPFTLQQLAEKVREVLDEGKVDQGAA